MKRQEGLAGRLAAAFLHSKLTPLIIAASLAIGIGAVRLLPREEEPQILVPIIDVFVQMPGATPAEVEARVTKPMERLLWEIPGVEYLYSTTSAGGAMCVVRFKVGEDEERAMVRVNEKLHANYDLIPPGASPPLIKPRALDDVPVLALTLTSGRYDSLTLRQLAASLREEINRVPDVSEVTIIGGGRRELRVLVDPARAAGFGLAPAQIANVLRGANQQLDAGAFAQGNHEVLVRTGGFLRNADDAKRLIVSVANGRPIYLGDVATITDGPAEPADYVYSGLGMAAARERGELKAGAKPEVTPAVTLAIAKRKGANATTVARTVLSRIHVPPDVQLLTTRNYGETAADKSNELLFHMFLAVLSVTLLVAVVLGRRESAIVAIAIPVTLALTLSVFYLFGYTLNRVTLFALIFSIGILVDDAIVVVENIVRHHRLPESQRLPLREVVIHAVAEVGNPTILATLAVIAAILPMGFVRGLTGPYMRPIPVGASAAMLFSLVIAFVVTPWAAVRLLKRQPQTAHTAEGWSTRMYRRVMQRIVRDWRWRVGFLAGVALLLVASISLFALKVVRLKILPFDNKSELQIVIDMPEGTTLERTAAAARAIGDEVAKVPEVANWQMYAGTASPYNFNGLVRHYFLRRGANVADLQVNFLPKDERHAQSHEIAKRIRASITPVARAYGARVKVAEVPPGPPVLQTLVAEIYGPDYGKQTAIARQVERIFDRTPGVVDVDSYVEDDQPQFRFVVDREKAALSGVSQEQIDATLRLALSGMNVGLLHAGDGATDSGRTAALPQITDEELPIVVQVPRALRSSVGRLASIDVASATGKLVPLGTLVHIEEVTAPKSIYHKNLMPVVYVTGDVAGAEESSVYAILQLNRTLEHLGLDLYFADQPPTTARYALKWDGEWQITHDVFLDLGIAFAVVLVLIYILVVGWFDSFKTPLAIMAAIPFALVGIVPAHALMGAFFTATSMVGFIAGAGIVVRNSIILVDFIELRLKQGMELEEAVVDAGAVRFRPMMLTAAAVIVGAAVILFDPIFQGLAISLMAGEVASLLLSRATVPVLYYLSVSRRRSDPDTTQDRASYAPAA